MLPSYSSFGSHAPPPAKLPLGKPGSRVFDTHSTCSEDGGTTSKKELDTTRKVAPVADTVVALQAAAAKIYGQPGFPAGLAPQIQKKEPEPRDSTAGGWPKAPKALASEPFGLEDMLSACAAPSTLVIVLTVLARLPLAAAVCISAFRSTLISPPRRRMRAMSLPATSASDLT